MARIVGRTPSHCVERVLTLSLEDYGRGEVYRASLAIYIGNSAEVPIEVQVVDFFKLIAEELEQRPQATLPAACGASLAQIMARVNK